MSEFPEYPIPKNKKRLAGVRPRFSSSFNLLPKWLIASWSKKPSVIFGDSSFVFLMLRCILDLSCWMPKDTQKIHDEIQEVRQKKIYRVRAAQDMWPGSMDRENRSTGRQESAAVEISRVGEFFYYIQIFWICWGEFCSEKYYVTASRYFDFVEVNFVVQSQRQDGLNFFRIQAQVLLFTIASLNGSNEYSSSGGFR